MFTNNHVNINGKHLTSCSYHFGGGMRGAYKRQTIKAYDDKYAKISNESAEWRDQTPEISEYLVEISIMSELEDVIRKNKMNFWHNKKFTDMFVDDGESSEYCFDFEDKYIRFSSQIYPEEYREKINQLSAVIEKYMNNSIR